MKSFIFIFLTILCVLSAIWTVVSLVQFIKERGWSWEDTVVYIMSFMSMGAFCFGSVGFSMIVLGVLPC